MPVASIRSRFPIIFMPPLPAWFLACDFPTSLSRHPPRPPPPPPCPPSRAHLPFSLTGLFSRVFYPLCFYFVHRSLCPSTPFPPSSAHSFLSLVLTLSSQYPASGLLLREEFRTFVEVEDAGGERVYEPVEPLVRPLKNFGIADGSDGGGKKQQLYETLVMRVTVPAHSQSWGINICPKDHKGFEDIVFHFNPRRRFVAMNNRDANMWGTQV